METVAAAATRSKCIFTGLSADVDRQNVTTATHEPPIGNPRMDNTISESFSLVMLR